MDIVLILLLILLNGVFAMSEIAVVSSRKSRLQNLADDGSPMLDYELSDYVWEGVKRAYLSMAELQFAAGAQRVRQAHIDASYQTSWTDAKKAIAELPLKKFRATLFTAHLMGGCAMSQNPIPSPRCAPCWPLPATIPRRIATLAHAKRWSSSCARCVNSLMRPACLRSVSTGPANCWWRLCAAGRPYRPPR